MTIFESRIEDQTQDGDSHPGAAGRQHKYTLKQLKEREGKLQAKLKEIVKHAGEKIGGAPLIPKEFKRHKLRGKITVTVSRLSLHITTRTNPTSV
jgi:hypothetical protein